MRAALWRLVIVAATLASPGLVSANGEGDDTPDFVPDAEPESRAVERFRVPLSRDRVFIDAPKEAGPTRVWIVSFIDMTCAPCRKHVAQLLTLKNRHQKPLPVEIQFRQFPVAGIPMSRHVARAVITARKMRIGRPFLSRLVADGAVLSPIGLVRTAMSLGANGANFTAVANFPVLGQEMADDFQVAAKFGVASAPTYFINGRRFSGVQTDDVLDAIVSHEIAAASRVAAKREARSDLYAILTETAKSHATGPPRMRFDDVSPTEIRLGASPARGAAGAPVLVTVFSDLYCPHGAEHTATLKKLLDEFGGKIRVVFKHRPVTVFAASRAAACATIAAQEQAKFWEMHDKIVGGLAPGHAREDGEATIDQRIPKRLLEYAAEIKLDMEAFRLVMESEPCQKEIDGDLALAAKLGVTGTPTTFVNGRRIVGAAPIDVFRAVIEDELRKGKK